MADTTNVGEIAVEVVARTNQLEQGMKSAGTTVDSFSKLASKSLDDAGKSFSKFELSGKGGKRVIQDLAVSMGEAGGPIGSLAGSIIKMGPALGVAVAGFEIYNQVMAQSKKYAADAGQEAEQYAKIVRMVGEATGAVPVAGIFSEKYAGMVDQVNQSLVDLKSKMSEVNSTELFGPGAAQRGLELRQEITATTAESAKLLKLVRELRSADEAARTFKETDYGIKIHTNKDSVDHAQQEMAALITYNQSLRDSMSEVGVGGTAYNTILDKWRENYVKILDLQDEIEEKNKKAGEQANKNFGKGLRDIAQQAKNIWDNSWMNGRMVKPVKAEKIEPPEMVKTGFAMQLDTTNVSAAAMRMADTKVQKVTDPALDQIGKDISTIAKNSANTGMARAL